MTAKNLCWWCWLTCCTLHFVTLYRLLNFPPSFHTAGALLPVSKVKCLPQEVSLISSLQNDPLLQNVSISKKLSRPKTMKCFNVGCVSWRRSRDRFLKSHFSFNRHLSIIASPFNIGYLNGKMIKFLQIQRIQWRHRVGRAWLLKAAAYPFTNKRQATQLVLPQNTNKMQHLYNDFWKLQQWAGGNTDVFFLLKMLGPENRTIVVHCRAVLGQLNSSC